MKALKLIPVLAVASALFLAGCNGTSYNINKDQQRPDGMTYYEEYNTYIKPKLEVGDFDGAAIYVGAKTTDKDGVVMDREEQLDDLVKNTPELVLLERGLISLNSGNYKQAILYFDAAEIKLEQAETKSGTLTDITKASQDALVVMTGSAESGDYWLRGYEKVMLFNYKAFCYMLMGDRRAYNVTRKAIDMQQQEWEELRPQIEKAQEDLAAKKAENPDMAQYIENESQHGTVEDRIQALNAFVNPFGDYIDGMIMDIDSIQNKAMRDNARIAYQKVLELNPNCTAAKNAIAELKKKNPPAGQKLVHVILAEGFQPYKEVHTTEDGIKYTTLTEQISPFAAARVTPLNKNGKNLTSAQALSPLSLITNIALRDYMAYQPMRELLYWRTLLAAQVAPGLISSLTSDKDVGALGAWATKALVMEFQNPETRSWSTLPRQVQVIRFYVPNSAASIKLETLAEGKQKIAETTVPLSANGPTVVYAVNYNQYIQALANEISWVDNAK